MIFIKDGVTLRDGKIEDGVDNKPDSIKLDIKPFIMKYSIKETNENTKFPMKFIRAQRRFFRRSYLDILEVCSQNLTHYSIKDLRESQLKEQVS